MVRGRGGHGRGICRAAPPPVTYNQELLAIAVCDGGRKHYCCVSFWCMLLLCRLYVLEGGPSGFWLSREQRCRSSM